MKIHYTHRLLLSTALTTIVGFGYGRLAYGQTVVAGDWSGGNTATVDLQGPGDFATQGGFSVAVTSTYNVTGRGVNIYSSGAGDTSFTAANGGSISGGYIGIRGENQGTGALSITTTGDVTGGLGEGILAENNGTNLTISTGAVDGYRTGIKAYNNGTGALDITSSGRVAGYAYNGIYAKNASSATSLTIAADEVVLEYGYYYTGAINAKNEGSGALSITTTGRVGSLHGNGIIAENDGTDLLISVDGVAGGYDGINAFNNGSGALSITATGQIGGGRGPTSGSGIVAENRANSVNPIDVGAVEDVGLNINVVGVDGDEDGITALNDGSGALLITATGDVEGQSDNGIFAKNSSNGSELIISVGKVTGGDDGIDAKNYGDGALSITATGDVAGTGFDGVNATNYTGDGDLTVNVAKVDGEDDGIFARNYSQGALRITATGDVTGTNDAGIFATNGSDATDLTISAATVTGDGYGIYASNDGDGVLSITATGDVEADNLHGVRARNSSGGGDMTLDLAKVTGGEHGVLADNDGDGALSIITTGDVVGTSYDGINGNNSAAGTSLTIVAEKVTGGSDGIDATNFGDGALSITATGDVTGTNEDGIAAYNTGNGSDLTISAASVTGGYGGIDALNGGDGALSVTATGDVEGATLDGVRVSNSSDGGDMTLDLAKVTGATNGISANNTGTGALSITATGDVVGTADDGIKANNSYDSTSLTISAKKVTGGSDGIFASNDGDGALSITATGDVEGTSDYGIRALNGVTSKSIIIAADTVTGGKTGINARNYGTEDLTIAASGDVEGTSSYGVYAFNTNNANGMTISANNVTGGKHGVYADNDGRGALSVTTTGRVAGDTAKGLYATSDGTDLSVSVNVVSGKTDGVYAYNTGSGVLSITATGDVVGTDGRGISAQTDIYATNLTISAANVTGGTDGVLAFHDGTGALSITASGEIEGVTRHGVEAYNFGTDLDINVGKVTAETHGIYAYNNGSGALSITASGEVHAEKIHGISAYNLGASTNMTITANAVTGNYGIEADNQGSGAVRITTHGDVTGHTYNGIQADNQGTDLKITTANVTGAVNGISGNNDGSGAFEITAKGDVVGKTGMGIAADNAASGTSLDVTAANVTGATSGIKAVNAGSGAASVTATGAVTAKAGDGIYVTNQSSEEASITIAEGGSVRTLGVAAGEYAIEVDAPNGAIVVNNLGRVTGRVNLSNSNVFANAGTWDLTGTTSNFNATGDSRVENQGLIVAAKGAVNEASVIDNLDVFRNSAGGVIRLADGDAGDTFRVGNTSSGAADFAANGGTVALDVVFDGDASVADRLIVDGDVTLGAAATELAITPVGARSNATTRTGIEVVTVGGTSEQGAFVLDKPLELGALAYTLSRGECGTQQDHSWYLCNDGQISTVGLAFEAMPGVLLNGFARSVSLEQRLGSRLWGASGTGSGQNLNASPADRALGPWVRMWGETGDWTPVTSTAGMSSETGSWGLEAGVATRVGDHAAGDLIGGVTLRYGATSASLANATGAGSVDAEGFGVGGSLTWFGASGFYLDAKGAADFVSVDVASGSSGTLLRDHRTAVYSASAEVGQRISLGSGTTLVPQAQLSWGSIGDTQLTDALGNEVGFGKTRSLISRVGLAIERDIARSALGSGKVYAVGSVLNDHHDSHIVTVAGTDLKQGGGARWAEVGVGFAFEPAQGSSLHGEVSYRDALGDMSGGAVSATVGWSMKW